jgi:hypothetical protein
MLRENKVGNLSYFPLLLPSEAGYTKPTMSRPEWHYGFLITFPLKAFPTSASGFALAPVTGLLSDSRRSSSIPNASSM